MAGHPTEVLILSGNEWDRIKKSAQPRQNTISGNQQLKERRKQLYLKSKADVATWSNTIEGQRKARLKAKEERAAAREAELVAMDLENARREAEERKEAIHRAKILMLKQTDVMKNFERAQLLTEVINERNKQGNFREQRQKLMNEHDTVRMQIMEDSIREAELKEIEKQERRKAEAREVASNRLEEAAKKRASLRAAKEEAIEERIRMAKDTEAFFAEQKAQEEEKRLQALALAREREEFEEKRQELLRHKALLEDVTLEKANLHRDARQRLEDTRKQNEITLRQNEIKKRETLAATLLEIEQSDEAAQEETRRQIEEERWAALERKENEKAERRRRANEEIEEYRRQVVAQKEEAMKAELEADRKEREMIESEYHKAVEAEKKKQEKKALQSRKMLESHADTIRRHEMAVAEERERLRYEKERAAETMEMEAELLKRMAAAHIQQAKAQDDGTVYPLQQAMKAFEPPKPKQRPFLPSQDVRGRGNPYPNDTRRRLGMTWD